MSPRPHLILQDPGYDLCSARLLSHDQRTFEHVPFRTRDLRRGARVIRRGPLKRGCDRDHLNRPASSTPTWTEIQPSPLGPMFLQAIPLHAPKAFRTGSPCITTNIAGALKDRWQSSESSRPDFPASFAPSDQARRRIQAAGARCRARRGIGSSGSLPSGTQQRIQLETQWHDRQYPSFILPYPQWIKSYHRIWWPSVTKPKPWRCRTPPNGIARVKRSFAAITPRCFASC